MSTALDTIREKIARELAAQRDTVPAPGGRNVSVKGKIFKLPNGQTSPGPMQAVILDWRNHNRYYTSAYNPNKPEPPMCFSLMKDLKTLAPHGDARQPQADDCGSCPHNKWKSDPKGGNGKACKNTVRIAITVPDCTPDDEPLILNVSPTGMTSWSTFIAGVDALGLLAAEVTCEISFNPNVDFPQLVFKATGRHENLENVWAVRDKAQPFLDASPSANE